MPRPQMQMSQRISNSVCAPLIRSTNKVNSKGTVEPGFSQTDLMRNLFQVFCGLNRVVAQGAES